MSVYEVSSEIGKLRQVILHRPGIEIGRITPQNKDALLFDDLLWLDRAQEEHDNFAGILRARGVDVLYFRDLLVETLGIEAARAELIDQVVSPTNCGPRVSRELRAVLRDVEVDRLVDVMLGGLLEQELPGWGIDALFADAVSDRFHYILRPLPNLLFMRDNASWINDGLSRNVLATPARKRESLYIEAIYQHHPRFAGAAFPIWYGNRPGDQYPASIEGGDVLVLNSETVIIGIGERTSPAAVETLALRLFEGGVVDKVIVAHLRQDRAVMHLDTVFTMVDVGKFNVYPGIVDQMEVHVLRPSGPGRLEVEQPDGIESVLRKCLGRDDLAMIPTGGDAIGRQREQWDDGNNTLAIEPGVVVAYERNQETNHRFADHGVEVISFDASELCHGRGGSRCMSQPLLRDPVDWGH